MVVFMKGYTEFADLISGAAIDENKKFIEGSASLPMHEIAKKIDRIKARRIQVQELEIDKKLGLFQVDCTRWVNLMISKWSSCDPEMTLIWPFQRECSAG